MPDSTDEFSGFAPAPAASAPDEFAGFAKAPSGGTTESTPTNPGDVLSQGFSQAAKGASYGLVDTGRGIYQLGASLGHAMGMVSDEKMKEIQKGVDDARQEHAPVMDTTAGKIGNIGAQALGMALMPEALPAKLASIPLVADAISGGTIAGLQPTATGESRAKNAAEGVAGGAVGSAAGKLLGAAVQPIKTALDPVGRAAVKTLKDAGIPLDLYQQTGNRIAKSIKNVIADNPLIGHSEFPQQQGQSFNRAVLRTMGIHDPAVTAADEQTMAEGRQKIKDVMDDVGNRTSIEYDPELEADLAEIGARVPSELSPNDAGPVYKNLENIMTSAANNNEATPGLVYQKIRSQLGALSKNGKYQSLSSDIQEAFDDALQRSASPEDQEALATARRHYRAMKQIEGAIDPATGNISPSKLITQINTARNRNQALYGKGDQSLVKLAKAAKHVLGANNPDSGTARRIAGMVAMGAVTGAGDAAIHGDPSEAVKAGVVGAALPLAGRALLEKPWAVNTAMKWNNSPIIKGTTDAARRALAAGTPATIDVEKQDTPVSPDAAPRASGGRTGPTDDDLVQRLMKRYRAAKRAEDASTKPLLEQPDAAIIHALKISGSRL